MVGENGLGMGDGRSLFRDNLRASLKHYHEDYKLKLVHMLRGMDTFTREAALSNVCLLLC